MSVLAIVTDEESHIGFYRYLYDWQPRLSVQGSVKDMGNFQINTSRTEMKPNILENYVPIKWCKHTFNIGLVIFDQLLLQELVIFGV